MNEGNFHLLQVICVIRCGWNWMLKQTLCYSSELALFLGKIGMTLCWSITAVNWNPMVVQSNSIDIWSFGWQRVLLDDKTLHFERWRNFKHIISNSYLKEWVIRKSNDLCWPLQLCDTSCNNYVMLPVISLYVRLLQDFNGS